MVREHCVIILFGEGKEGYFGIGFVMYVFETYIDIGCYLFQKYLILWTL